MKILIYEIFSRFSPDGRHFTGYVNMSDWMNNPSVLEIGNNFDDLTRGLVCQHSLAVDKYHGFQVIFKFFVSQQKF